MWGGFLPGYRFGQRRRSGVTRLPFSAESALEMLRGVRAEEPDLSACEVGTVRSAAPCGGGLRRCDQTERGDNCLGSEQ